MAVIALAGQLSGFAHLVLVRHVTCAEHGDMIEVGRNRAIAAKAVHRQAPVTFADASSEESHGHEHCLIAPMRRDRIAAGAPASLDQLHVDAYCTIGRIANDEASPPIAIIVLAPKNSPPLA